MRYILAALAALCLAIFLHPPHPGHKPVKANNPRLNHPHANHGPSCAHCRDADSTARSASGNAAFEPSGVLWESQLTDPSSAAKSLAITGTGLAAEDDQVGTRRRVTLEDGSHLSIEVTGRHIHTDGTIAITGTVAGKPKGRLHMQWNDADDFFLGQIYFDQLPVAYEITRDHSGTQTITRHSVASLVCAEVDPATGHVTYGLPALPNALDQESADAEGEPGGQEEGPSLVPSLNSYPSATAVVYLDFDGEQVTGTSWGSNINAAATGYSASKITDIWRHVAADMEPFNLNVTTDESVYLNAPASKRIRCIITPSNEWYGSSTAGGVAKLGSFTWSGDTPCWVFSDNLSNGTKYIAEACSHEVGHTFGLSHDGKSNTTYYAGHGSGAVGWAPIMGNSYFKSMTQWSKGEYTSATNTQDDLSIITSNNGFSYRNDDHGNQPSNATYLIANPSLQIASSGNIEQQGDTDVFEFESGDGTASININPASNHGNLDIRAELYNINGQLITSSNPATQVNASINASVSTGTYFLHIRATGYGTADTGFTDYASLGAYNVSGQIAEATEPTPFELSVASLPESQREPEHDPDSDGLTNLAEHALGTNPGVPDANQNFTFTEPSQSNPSNGIDFLIDLPVDIPADIIYTIEATCALDTNDWISIASHNTAGTWSGSATVTEESGPEGKHRFRISESPDTPWTCRFIRVSFSLASQTP